MKRLCAISIFMTLVTVLAGAAAPSLADTPQATMSSARAYFVRAYAMVIAGQTLSAQCDLLGTWQKQSLGRHADKLQALMAQRLPIKAVNQAKRIARDLVDRQSDCSLSARSIVDDSLFAAHGLVYSRAEGTEPNSVTPKLKEFLAWANSEIKKSKPKRPIIVAVKKKKKKKKRQPSGGFERYEASVVAYYLERHCKHLSRRAARSYWKLVKRAHKRAVAAFGAARVSSVQRQAERSAKRRAGRCGRKTKAKVMAGYRSVQKKKTTRRLRASLTLTSRSHEAFLGR